MSPIRILLADDHKIFRDGLRSLLEQEALVAVVGEAGNESEVLAQLEQHAIDVILMDIDMGVSNGIETTATVRGRYPQTHVLVLSMHSDINYIVGMLDVGATGYVLKNTGKDELLTAIRAVAGGDTYYSNQVSARLVEHLHSRKRISSPRNSGDVPLTKREVEVLRLIAEEFSNPEIAQQLFISIRTVDTHRRNLIEKLGVKNTAGLVKYAIKNGLIGD